LGVGEDGRSLWGAVHGGGGSSGEGRRWEAEHKAGGAVEGVTEVCGVRGVLGEV
jgi:hypothetical protein